MRGQVEIVLTEVEKSRLERVVSSQVSSVRLVFRAKIVLLASEQTPNYRIAELLGTTPNTVARWRNRYRDSGYDALVKDRPRGGNYGGKNSLEQQKLRSLIIEKTTTQTPAGQTHWSCRTMAAAVGTSHSFVNRVWQQAGLKPHLSKTFKVSNDPRFEEKLCDVVGLYLDPPVKAVVFSVDEKSSIQALDRTQPSLPIKKGRNKTVTHDYKRHGTSSLFAALNVATGEIINQCYRRHRHQEFLAFLKTVEKSVDPDFDIHIIVDNYATHKHAKVKEWLENNQQVKLHFIPTSSSWLNLVERFFSLITDKAIRRGVFSSVKQLEEAIQAFIDQHNAEPKPFVWTKTTDQILQKIGRAKTQLQKLSTT